MSTPEDPQPTDGAPSPVISLGQAQNAHAQAVEILDTEAGVVSVGIAVEEGSYVLRVGVDSTSPVFSIPDSLDGVPVRVVTVGSPTVLT